MNPSNCLSVLEYLNSLGSNLRRNGFGIVTLYSEMLNKCNKWHELELFVESILGSPDEKKLFQDYAHEGKALMTNPEKESYHAFPLGWVPQFDGFKGNLLYLLSKAKKKLSKYDDAQMYALQSLQENPHLYETFTLLYDDSESILKPSSRVKDVTSGISPKISSHYHNDREIYDLFEQGAYKDALMMTTRELSHDKSLLSNKNFIALHVGLLSLEREISKLESLKNQLTILYPEGSSCTHYSSALLLQLNGEITRAQNQFYQACEMNINDQHCAYWMALGHAYAQTGEHYESISAYNNAVKMAPFSIWPTLARVSEYIRTRQVKMARECLLESFEWSRDHPATLNELSILYYQNEEMEKALNVLEGALSQVSKHDIVLQMALKCNYVTITLKTKKRISLGKLIDLLNVDFDSSIIIPEYYLVASLVRELAFSDQNNRFNDHMKEARIILNRLLQRFPENKSAKKSLERIELKLQSELLQSSPEIITRDGRRRSLRKAMTRLSFLKE